MLQEERVVSNAETEDNVKVGFRVVEQFGLTNGIAHRLIAAGIDFVVVGKTKFFLVFSAHLAYGADYLKALAAEQVFHSFGFAAKTGAKAKTDFLVAHFLAENQSFLQSWPLTVALSLNSCAGGKKVHIGLIFADYFGHSLFVENGAIFGVSAYLGFFTGMKGAAGTSVHDMTSYAYF